MVLEGRVGVAVAEVGLSVGGKVDVVAGNAEVAVRIAAAVAGLADNAAAVAVRSAGQAEVVVAETGFEVAAARVQVVRTWFREVLYDQRPAIQATPDFVRTAAVWDRVVVAGQGLAVRVVREVSRFDILAKAETVKGFFVVQQNRSAAVADCRTAHSSAFHAVREAKEGRLSLHLVTKPSGARLPPLLPASVVSAAVHPHQPLDYRPSVSAVVEAHRPAAARVVRSVSDTAPAALD